MWAASNRICRGRWLKCGLNFETCTSETMSTHWTDDQILNRFYGLAENDGHLASCASCRARLEQAALRRPVLQSGDPAHAFLAVQRRQIYDRVESGGSHFSLKMIS